MGSSELNRMRASLINQMFMVYYGSGSIPVDKLDEEVWAMEVIKQEAGYHSDMLEIADAIGEWPMYYNGEWCFISIEDWVDMNDAMSAYIDTDEWGKLV